MALEDFLLSPVGLIAISAVCLTIIGYYFLKPKPKNTFIIERIRPHYNVIRNVKESKSVNPGDTILTLQDGRQYTIPKDQEHNVELLQVPKTVKIAKGLRKLWLLEKDEIVKMSDNFIDDNTQLITPSMITPILNRGSLRRLANAKGGAGGWTMVILAGIAAFAVGYILYPSFNHPAPIIQCFKQLGNGTLVSFNCGAVP